MKYGWTVAVAMAWACLAVAQEKPAIKPFSAPPAEMYKAIKNLAYATDAGDRQKLDLYLPTGAKGPTPLIVWVHGGGWEAGSKDFGVAPFWFVGQGYAVASINYRLSKQAPFPAQIQDCKAAIRWLKAHATEYQFDPERVGVWGASAGGHLVALLGTTGHVKELEGSAGPTDPSSKVACVCDWFGPTDMLGWANELGADSGFNRNSPVSRLMGGPVLEKSEVAKLANPITHLRKDAAPIFIMHGDKDMLVPLKQSELLRDAYQKAGVEATLVVVPGAGHGNGFSTADYGQKIEAFFAKHLKPAR